MEHSRFCLLFFFTFCLLQATASPQSKVDKDTLYERLKQKDINKMTQREYDYFMLMKHREVNEEPSAPKQGVLNGVVTYFFNFNYGDKPDVGSDVFILSAKYRDKWVDVMKYQSAVLSKAIGMNEGMSSSEFEALETHVDEFIDEIRYNKVPGVTSVVADGSGGFSVSLDPGTYYLIGRSAHRTSSNKVEIMGQIDVASEEVKSGQSTSVKLRFQDR